MNKKISDKKRKVICIIGLIAFVSLMLILGFTVGKKIVTLAKTPKKFRLWVNSTGIWGKFIMIGIAAFQIIVAVVPGEPIEIAAGYAFGWLQGAILCLIGTLLGQAIVFLFAKKFGMDFVQVFVKKEKLEKIEFLKNKDKLYSSIFFIFLIPGTPKDVLSYVAGITPIKLIPFLLISCLARIPSVVSSTIGGGLLGGANYKMAIVVFIVTFIISLICFFIYKKYEKSRA
ncbi:MAG: VTT domain-containing protein [Terrisporobacter sp.]|uniref:TVP38/TMEM64 family protein n=1 Tax=Terrisporobacter sp. TaxID=1965305 RepID=UPI002FCB5DEA